MPDKLDKLAGELPPYGFLYNSWVKSDAAKLICDASLIILAVNEEIPFMFGFHASELIGQPVHVLLPTSLRRIHEDTHTKGYVERPRDRAMTTGGELRGQRKDGTEFPVFVHLIRYHDKDKGLLVEATIRHANEAVRVQKEDA